MKKFQQKIEMVREKKTHRRRLCTLRTNRQTDKLAFYIPDFLIFILGRFIHMAMNFRIQIFIHKKL